MSHKLRTISNSEAACEKYLSKMLRQENVFATKRSPVPKFHGKFPGPDKITMQKTNNKTKMNSVNNVRQQSPMQRGATPIVVNLNAKEYQKEHKNQKPRARSKSRSESKDREAWGQILLSNKSKEKVSNFSNFDPLRTLHFLAKELYTKLQGVIPDEDELLQMVTDIQLALKRIPPEVSTLLHNPQVEYTQWDTLGCVTKSMSTKTCQTPPTLYQEDTEKFQKIMEENTYRLEASCKQLEIVCTNLQNEKEMTEKELDEARENVELLCKRVKELENEIEEMSNLKIKQLENEKKHLELQLNKATEEVRNNPAMNHLKKLIDELKKQKLSSDETCARLEYDMTLLKMEKEKFITMLALRDREIKDIQQEMAKIQDQVNQQLKKLNGEVEKKVTDLKTLAEPFTGGRDNHNFLDIGDTTISSITTNESDREPINVIKESPCGDAEVNGFTRKESEDNLPLKLKASNVELNLPEGDREEEPNFDDLLDGLTPSVRALLTNHR